MHKKKKEVWWNIERNRMQNEVVLHGFSVPSRVGILFGMFKFGFSIEFLFYFYFEHSWLTNLVYDQICLKTSTSIFVAIVVKAILVKATKPRSNNSKADVHWVFHGTHLFYDLHGHCCSASSRCSSVQKPLV